MIKYNQNIQLFLVLFVIFYALIGNKMNKIINMNNKLYNNIMNIKQQ